jgi:hypothetical protein
MSTRPEKQKAREASIYAGLQGSEGGNKKTARTGFEPVYQP